MKKHIRYIFALLLSSTAVLSCANDLIPNEEDPIFDAGGTSDSSMYFSLSISGSATDEEAGTALEDVQITVEAYQFDKNVYTKTAYTDNKGRFNIAWDGYRKPTSIKATAEDRNGTYKPCDHEIRISWDSSYNMKDGVLYINDCDFYMQKVR